MKTSNAILAVAAVAATSIWRAERRHHQQLKLVKHQHEQRIRLDTAALHQQLLEAIATDPKHWEIWTSGDRSPERLSELVRVNRQVSFTQLKFELGLLDLDELYVQVRSLMKRDAVRSFWNETREFRSEESRDDKSRVFVSVLDRECSAASLNSAESAPA